MAVLGCCRRVDKLSRSQADEQWIRNDNVDCQELSGVCSNWQRVADLV